MSYYQSHNCKLSIGHFLHFGLLDVSTKTPLCIYGVMHTFMDGHFQCIFIRPQGLLVAFIYLVVGLS